MSHPVIDVRDLRREYVLEGERVQALRGVSLVIRRNTGFNHVGAQSEYHVGTRRHWSCGLSVMTVSIIENGAGSVLVSARPALPNTRSTSGN